jgi:hypothetical protein
MFAGDRKNKKASIDVTSLCDTDEQRVAILHFVLLNVLFGIMALSLPPDKASNISLHKKVSDRTITWLSKQYLNTVKLTLKGGVK